MSVRLKAPQTICSNDYNIIMSNYIYIGHIATLTYNNDYDHDCLKTTVTPAQAGSHVAGPGGVAGRPAGRWLQASPQRKNSGTGGRGCFSKCGLHPRISVRPRPPRVLGIVLKSGSSPVSVSAPQPPFFWHLEGTPELIKCQNTNQNTSIPRSGAEARELQAAAVQ